MALSSLLRRLLGCTHFSYFDDSISLDFKDSIGHLINCLQRLLRCFGVVLKVEKTQCGTEVKFLGVMLRFEDDGSITIEVSERRRLSLLRTIENHLDSNSMSRED